MGKKHIYFICNKSISLHKLNARMRGEMPLAAFGGFKSFLSANSPKRCMQNFSCDKYQFVGNLILLNSKTMQVKGRAALQKKHFVNSEAEETTE